MRKMSSNLRYLREEPKRFRAVKLPVILTIIISLAVIACIIVALVSIPVHKQYVGDVKDLHIVRTNPTSVKLKWKAVEGADCYYVYHRLYGGEFIRSEPITTTKYKLKKLRQAVDYYVCVTAFNSSGESKHYTETSVFTRPSKPEFTYLRTSVKGKARIKWKQNYRAYGYVFQYKLRKEKDFSLKNVLRLKPSRNINVLLTNLIPNAVYDVRVKTVSKYNEERYTSGWSKLSFRVK